MQGITYQDTSKISVNKELNGCFRVNYQNRICQAFIKDEITLELKMIDSKIKSEEKNWLKLDEFNSTKEVLVDSVIFFN